MPTNRRKRLQPRRPRVGVLTADMRLELETGRGYFDSFHGDRTLLEAAWQAHGAEVLETFIRDHPGHRPFAWWLLEHEQERPIKVPAAFTTEAVERMRAETWGFLHTHVHCGYLPSGRSSEFQEPEPDYLARRGLLTAAERRALADRDDDQE